MLNRESISRLQQSLKFSIGETKKELSCWSVFSKMKRLLFYVTALLLFLVIGLVYYFNEKKDFDGAAKYMEWGVMLMCAGVFLKMAPTKLYGNSGYLRAYVLSFALSGVCYWYTMGIVESYKDGADMPVTLIKQEQIKLKDMGNWTLDFTILLSLTSPPPVNEMELQTDLAYYHLTDGFEVTNKLPPVYDDKNGWIHQTINTQITFDEFTPRCDYDFSDGCFAIFSIGFHWNLITMNQLRQSYGENPIYKAMLAILNPDSDSDKFGSIQLPHDEEDISVVYDFTAQQRKKIDGSEKKWLDFSQNNNVAGQSWLDFSQNFENAHVTFMLQTNEDGEVSATTMEEKPLFSADQAFTSFLAFCTALFTFFSYFFPKTLPKRRVKFSNTKLKFEAQSTFDVLQFEMTEVPEADEEDAKHSEETTSTSTKKILTSNETSCI